VVEAIARGELDEELGVLGAVINQRVRLLATARSMTTLASLRVGDRARITTTPTQLPARPSWDGERVGRTSSSSSTSQSAASPGASCVAHHSSSSHWHLNSYASRASGAAAWS
jgi:hypothetical protein